ncbi:hypothetical protein [Hyperthermus butylicus]|uniref:Uncharacterized protein n=1 Tax=Hyperthermus butylicus (strain DSM 5456 / JCM 9403 / PLM1-5) TaxID=415426 RepID=A2BM32_HYPBU|nr:hypothetical protein [Hyperthermus butylicus]ABM81043.1 hypothetical protein Hbut_1209 [Hyperthermus butylicus DSM 5456]
MAQARRRLLERKLKEMLLEQAKRAGISPEQLAEWLYESAGIRVKATWHDVEREVLRSDEVSAQELAAYLLSEGVEVDESKWLDILRQHGLSKSIPRLPREGEK